MSALRLARGVTAPRPSAQVRRLLPRPRRRAARERRLGPRDARRSRRRRACRRGRPPTRSSCPYNDVDGGAAAVERYGEGLAAILVEPVAGNMGCVPPAPGFLEALRALCDASGALLVFDEVITGFRVARGGAQERYGVDARPDDPRQDRRRRPARSRRSAAGPSVMERLAPVGDVYQAGTLSGNPLATAAGLSVLRRLRDPGVYEELERLGARLEAGLAPLGTRAARRRDADALLRRRPVRDYEDAPRATPSASARSSATARRGRLPARRRSSSACSSRSPTATRRSTAQSRPLPILRRLSRGGRHRAPTARGRERALGARRSARSASASGSASSRRSRRRALRPRARDDLRGLPRPLRALAALRAARRRRRPPARRLPLRPRARPHRATRASGGGRGARRADLALRTGCAPRARRRRGRLGARRRARRRLDDARATCARNATAPLERSRAPR